MTPALSSGDVERFRAAVARRTGLWFDDQKLESLAQVLERRLQALNQPAPSYLASLETQTGPRPRVARGSRRS